MSATQLVFLALSPIVFGVILLAARPALLLYSQTDEHRVFVRVALIVVSVATAAVLGLCARIGFDSAKRLLPNDDAEAPIQLMGAISLAFALVYSGLLILVVLVVAKDVFSVLRRR